VCSDRSARGRSRCRIHQGRQFIRARELQHVTGMGDHSELRARNFAC
jgi:hypothetical protein